MFFESRDHVLKAFREIGVREALLSPAQRPPEQYQQPGVWVYTVESVFDRFNKASREPSATVKKVLFRGNSVVRVEVVAQKEETLKEWVTLALQWLLEHPLEFDDHKFESFITPTRFSWLDEDGILPDTRAVRFEIIFGDAILGSVEKLTITPELEDVALEV